MQNIESPSQHFAGRYLISGPDVAPDLEDLISHSYFVIAE